MSFMSPKIPQPKIPRPVVSAPAAPTPTPAARPGAATFGSADSRMGMGGEVLLGSMNRRPELKRDRRTLLGG